MQQSSLQITLQKLCALPSTSASNNRSFNLSLALVPETEGDTAVSRTLRECQKFNSRVRGVEGE